MATKQLLQHLKGSFTFLGEDPEEARRHLEPIAALVPDPQRIFTADESETVLWGYPLLMTEDLLRLRSALEDYLQQEELMQLSVLQRRSIDSQAFNASWENYHRLLVRAFENGTRSNYGRHLPSIFWLHHGRDVARILKDSPRRVARLDSEVGRLRGDEIKYLIFDRFQDRILNTSYDLVNRLALETEESEDKLFPRLLRRLLDNVLVFTEDFVSHTLAELGSYFQGYLKIDGRELRKDLDTVVRWHARELRINGNVRRAVRHLLQADPDRSGRTLLRRRGYLRWLAEHEAFQGGRQSAGQSRPMLTAHQIEVWESLLVKLKEMEIYQALQRLVVPVRRDRAGRLYCRPASLSRTWVGAEELYLSESTRPLDFMAPWVIDPVVDCCGLIYDITDFSQLVSAQSLSGADRQDESFRQMARFQRRINRLAHSYSISMEKYLGDGAFYSGRNPEALLICAIHFQRHYRRAREEGFVFDRGLRLALNFGSFRQIPLGTSDDEGDGDVFEYFGHGLVELSRLTTGRTSRNLDEIKNILISQGYRESAVHRFFSPMVRKDVDLVDREAERSGFHAFINADGALVNEGIVATEGFLAQLELRASPSPLYRGRRGQLSYLCLRFQDGADRDFVVGLRKLGQARFKGLDHLPVYEVIDGVDLDQASLQEVAENGLVRELEREFLARRQLRDDSEEASPAADEPAVGKIRSVGPIP